MKNEQQGKLYLTYLANIENVPEDVKKLFIERTVPDSMSLSSKKISHVKDLAPPQDLSNKWTYKSIKWNDFAEKFNEYLKRETQQIILQNIKNNIKDGVSYCFICCKKKWETLLQVTSWKMV